MTPSSPYLAQRCGEIDSAIAEAEQWAAGNDKLGAYLAGYLTVVICGVVEDCVEHLIGNRAGRAQDQELQAFVHKTIHERFRNPDYNLISTTLGAFSSEYSRAFNQRIRPDERDALDSMVANKNNLAHVGARKQQSTIIDVREYYQRVKQILTVLESILG
ncbi:MAG: hypothetical protein FJ316_04585 [SAR202 cluster bacterium]|nr:hypothetical protein [SAR202 cluster bacterium]